MESQATVAAPTLPPEDDGPRLSPIARAIAVFTRPAEAWTGLKGGGQWWFPLLVVLLVNAGMMALLQKRALVPMLADAWEEAVSAGRMTAQAAERAEEFMSGPIGLAVTVGQQVILFPIIMLITALLVWFGVGFILGRKLRFGLAFTVVAWAGLITIPTQILFGVLAWTRETMKGIHTGLGVLIPESDPPNQLLTGVGFLLDRIGPLEIWWLAVVILGVAAVSGAPRKSTAWVLGGIYVTLMVVFACITGFTTRAG